MINIVKMPKELFDSCVEAGVEKVILEFEGGNDEGHLYVSFEGEFTSEDLEFKVVEWANEAYSYSGAGDGTSYGDNITYDLVNKKVSHQEWYHSVEYNEPSDMELELGE